ncbi:hypothetical protein DYQ86_03420 [Acidobacteria bacterium AB60]|nr:hypothetical protein DYQ86_03420 [Acidobacteria bacterium AB60]
MFASTVYVLAPWATAATNSGFRSETLFDPVMRMNAYTVNIPADWKMEGTVVQGTRCKTDPYPVFRAYAMDGLTEFRRMPRFDWGSSNSKVGGSVLAQCPQLSTDISAREFLRYVAHLTNADNVADWPLPPADRSAFMRSIEQANAGYAQSGMRGYSMRGDIAAVRSLMHNGTFEVEQQLLVALVCTRTPLPDGNYVIGCTAQVRALRAPKGKLESLVALISGHPGSGAVENPGWRQALNQAVAMHDQQIMQQREVAFRQWSATMAHNHQQFMNQMSAEGQQREDQFRAHIAAKDTATSDWVDYALDQQTVVGSGDLAKASSAYTYTWSNGQGQWYQTNDPGANPNAAFNGNWSKQQVVHGNGTPY